MNLVTKGWCHCNVGEDVDDFALRRAMLEWSRCFEELRCWGRKWCSSASSSVFAMRRSRSRILKIEWDGNQTLEWRLIDPWIASRRLNLIPVKAFASGWAPSFILVSDGVLYQSSWAILEKFGLMVDVNHGAFFLSVAQSEGCTIHWTELLNDVEGSHL